MRVGRRSAQWSRSDGRDRSAGHCAETWSTRCERRSSTSSSLRCSAGPGRWHSNATDRRGSGSASAGRVASAVSHCSDQIEWRSRCDIDLRLVRPRRCRSAGSGRRTVDGRRAGRRGSVRGDVESSRRTSRRETNDGCTYPVMSS